MKRKLATLVLALGLVAGATACGDDVVYRGGTKTVTTTKTTTQKVPVGGTATKTTTATKTVTKTVRK